MQVLKDEMKAEIDRAAVQVFLRKGFRKASMKEIALQAGTSVSNMYNYYPNKTGLFSALVTPVLESLRQLFRSLLEQEEDHSFAEKDFRREFEQVLLKMISRFLSLRRESLLLLFDKSEGTPFDSSREEVVSFMAAHFSDSLPAGKKSRENLLLMHIFASNLTEGLLEIIRHTRGEQERTTVLRGLIQYHINGIFPFFEEA